MMDREIAYRLEPADLSAWLAARRRCGCRECCLGWAGSLAVLAVVTVVVAAEIARGTGARDVVLFVAGIVGLAALIVAGREGLARLRCRRSAQALGLPRDVRLEVDERGIAQAPDRDGTGRTYAWSEVAGVDDRGPLTVVRLRVAQSAVLIPARAFAGPEDRAAFTRLVRERSGSNPAT